MKEKKGEERERERGREGERKIGKIDGVRTLASI
jgi:hypothetical protein